jgi:catechol 2,3-dioxygenase-like lactoylglutathione lyase family enzyme
VDRVDHTGLAVPDLDQAVAFFTALAGAGLVYRLDGSAHPVGERLAERVIGPRSATSGADLKVPRMPAGVYHARRVRPSGLD